jgi:hypothetical protein
MQRQQQSASGTPFGPKLAQPTQTRSNICFLDNTPPPLQSDGHLYIRSILQILNEPTQLADSQELMKLVFMCPLDR